MRHSGPATETVSSRAVTLSSHQVLLLPGREFDDEASTTFEWYPHDDSSSLLGCLEGTVPSAGLHGRHPAPSRSAPSVRAPYGVVSTRLPLASFEIPLFPIAHIGGYLRGSQNTEMAALHSYTFTQQVAR